MTLQRTQYWAASFTPLLPQHACGNWVGLLRPRQVYHSGKGVVALPLLLDAGSWPTLGFNILLLNGTQMLLRNLMSTVRHRQFVIPTVGGQKPQIPKPSKGLGILLVQQAGSCGKGGEVINWLNLWVIIMLMEWVGRHAKDWHYRYVRQAQTP